MDRRTSAISANIGTRQRRAIRAGLGAFALAWGAAIGVHAADEPGGIAQGRADYLTFCASCHGVNAEGDGPVSGSLKSRPPNLTYLKQQEMSGEFPHQRILETIQGNPDYAMNYRTHGPAEMPVWGKELTDASGDRETIAKARIRNLVKYLESIQK